jgi:hypothetical protein
MSQRSSFNECNKSESNYELVEDESGNIIKVNKFVICDANKVKDKDGEWYKFIYITGLPIVVKKINQNLEIKTEQMSKVNGLNDFIILSKYIISPDKFYYETFDEKEQRHFVKCSEIENYNDKKINNEFYNVQTSESEQVRVIFVSSKENYVEISNKGMKEIKRLNLFEFLCPMRIENNSEFYGDEENSYEYQVDYQEQIIPGLEPYLKKGFHFLIKDNGQWKIVSTSSIDKSDSRRDEKLVKVTELNTNKEIYVNHNCLKLYNSLLVISKTEITKDEGWQTIKSCSGKLFERKLIGIRSNKSDFFKNINNSNTFNFKNENKIILSSSYSDHFVINVNDIFNSLSLTYFYKCLNGYILDKNFNNFIETDCGELNIYIPDNLAYYNCLGKYVQDGYIIPVLTNNEINDNSSSDFELLLHDKTNFKFLSLVEFRCNYDEEFRLYSSEKYNLRENEMTVRHKYYNFLIDPKKVKLYPIFDDSIFHLAFESLNTGFSYTKLYKNSDSINKRAVIEISNLIPFYSKLFLNTYRPISSK